jgi:hypothetical protein
MTEISKGTLFLLTSGCYSDYGIMMSARALQDFNLDEVGKAFIAAYVPLETVWGSLRPSPDDFPAYLTAQGLIEDADLQEYHCGEYGDFNL